MLTHHAPPVVGAETAAPSADQARLVGAVEVATLWAAADELEAGDTPPGLRLVPRWHRALIAQWLRARADRAGEVRQRQATGAGS